MSQMKEGIHRVASAVRWELQGLDILNFGARPAYGAKIDRHTKRSRTVHGIQHES